MKKDKFEDIEIRRDSRIDFSHKGKEYSINVTNDNELRISVISDLIVVMPQACNSIIIANKKWEINE